MHITSCMGWDTLYGMCLCTRALLLYAHGGATIMSKTTMSVALLVLSVVVVVVLVAVVATGMSFLGIDPTALP